MRALLGLARLALAARETGYRLLSPADALVGRLRRREPLPPLWLRRHVGAARARRFRAVTEQGERLLDDLLRGEAVRDVLDLGCGCGAMAPYFQRILPADGSYLGLDVHSGCIAWSRERFRVDRRLAFDLLPGAADRARAGRYDLILAKSLFTHLLPEAAADYLEAAAATLTSRGRIVLTAFLFDASQTVVALPHAAPAGGVRFRTRWRPEAAIGYERETLHAMLARAGLELAEERLAFWPGTLPELSAQDLLVCRARRATTA